MSLGGKPTVAVLQPSFLPWLGYFDQMARADWFVYYDDVQFDKHGWRNRNRIKSLQGEPYWLTVPVLHKGKNKPLCNDIEINKTQDWAKKQIGTIRQFYSKAPFMRKYLPELEAILLQDWTRLMDLNLAVTKWMAQIFEIKTPTYFSSEIQAEGEQTERLVKLSQHFGAKIYYSGSAAREYLEVDKFKEVDIEVVWQDYAHPVYPQVSGAFVSHLSALDLILNVGPESAEYFRSPTPKGNA